MAWHPTSLKPVGRRLFSRDLHAWLEEQFEAVGERVMEELFGDEELVTRGVMWRALVDGAVIEPLSLGDPVFDERQVACDVGRDLTLTIAVPFSGDLRLLDACAAALKLGRPLVGVVEEDRLVLGVSCRSAHRALAETALMSDLHLLMRHVEEQAFAVALYKAGLRSRSRAYVAAEWQRHRTQRGQYLAARASAEFIDDIEGRLMARLFADMPSFDLSEVFKDFGGFDV